MTPDIDIGTGAFKVSALSDKDNGQSRDTVSAVGGSSSYSELVNVYRNSGVFSYSELRSKILGVLASGEWYNIPYLARILGVDRTVIHKVVRPLIEKGLIVKRKVDGLSWIRLAHKQLFEETRHEVDLILRTRVSQTQSRQSRPVRVSPRTNSFRREALRLLASANMLDSELWRTLNRLFNAYLTDVSHRAILLKKVDDDEWLFLPYKVRFSERGLRKALSRFNEVFSKGCRFSYGVWLTLTVDPKRYSNLVVMRYELQRAWNRFMSFLSKRLGFRPKCLRVIEFTKSGLIHYHVVLFGVWRLGDKRSELTPYLESIGFGKVSFLYQIVNRGGVWVPKKLVEVEESSCDGGGLPSNLRSYLSKYVSKVFRDLDNGVDEDRVNPIVLYWALNTRFFTYSMDLAPEPEVVVRTYEWEFWGSSYVVNPYLLPYHSLDPPWELAVPYTFPPLYVLGNL